MDLRVIRQAASESDNSFYKRLKVGVARSGNLESTECVATLFITRIDATIRTLVARNRYVHRRKTYQERVALFKGEGDTARARIPMLESNLPKGSPV